MKTYNNCNIRTVDDGTFEIEAPAGTDYFIDNLNQIKIANAPLAYEEVSADFDCRVRIKPDFTTPADAGCILIRDDDERWVKSAFELTDLGYTSVVTVVTDGVSDDSNGERVEEDAVWLRVLRKGAVWSIHYALDGERWKMVRYFELDLSRTVKVGVSAQCPRGSGCTSKFSRWRVEDNACDNMRNVR